MEIEYELTMEDLMAFHRYHGQNARIRSAADPSLPCSEV